MADKIKLTKKDRFAVAWRSQFLQGSWNYERMQNGGWAYTLIPAIKKLYKDPEDKKAALKRHMEFFNTHPYVAAPIVGVTLALEEERANGADVDDTAIQGVKVGMMGPLAGVGDPVFWFTLRPILGAVGAGLAISGSILGPILFFLLWNIIRFGFIWYTQEFGYHSGSKIADDLSGGLLQDVTKGASILGMFILAALVQRWVSINFSPFETELANGEMMVIYLQENLDSLIPGLAPLLLTLFSMWLLKKKVSPIVIIFGLFAVGILGYLAGILQ